MKIARISSSLLSEDEVKSLMLKEQYHIILLPKSLTHKCGILANELNFDLVKSQNGILSLIGRDSGAKMR